MNRMNLRGKIVSVGEAKFSRQLKARKRRVPVERGVQHAGDFKELSRGDVVTVVQDAEEQKDGMQVSANHDNEQMKRVEVAVVEENMNWLLRSLVGITLKLIDLQSLRKTLCKNMANVVEVSEIGACKVLITFDSVKHADEMLTFKMDRLLQFFNKVSRWEESARCESRRVWLECHGVPLHVWSLETFKTMGSLWGDVISCDIGTRAGSSFRSGRIQVDTGTFDTIQGWINISVGGSGFDVYVKEVGSEACGTERTMQDREGWSVIRTSVAGGSSRMADVVPGDPAAELMMVANKVVDGEEGRMVNDDVILNDLKFNFPNSDKAVMVRDSDSSFECTGKEDFGGDGLNGEEDSERTVTQEMAVCEVERSKENARICGVDELGLYFMEQYKEGYDAEGGMGLGIKGPIVKEKESGLQLGDRPQGNWADEAGAGQDQLRWVTGSGAELGRVGVSRVHRFEGKSTLHPPDLGTHEGKECLDACGVKNAGVGSAALVSQDWTAAVAHNSMAGTGRGDH
ncbi:hypothetical protein AHAS_Ahas19G0231000 [Arachis hypogaea]